MKRSAVPVPRNNDLDTLQRAWTSLTRHIRAIELDMESMQTSIDKSITNLRTVINNLDIQMSSMVTTINSSGLGGGGFGLVSSLPINFADDTLLLSGASVSSSNLIPAGAWPIGVYTKVTTVIAGSGGLTGYDIGLDGSAGTDVDAWGANAALTLNSTTDETGFTTLGFGLQTAAQDIIISANPVPETFSSGELMVRLWYFDCTTLRL